MSEQTPITRIVRQGCDVFTEDSAGQLTLQATAPDAERAAWVAWSLARAHRVEVVDGPDGPGPDPLAGLRPFGELRGSGLLWLINRVVFHPRGFALALVVREGEAIGWTLLGDGREVWVFNGSEDDDFAAANETLTAHKGIG